eukprot:10671037-Prorocentrum_lima.AAC.1
MLQGDGGGAVFRAQGEQACQECGFAFPAVRSTVELPKIHGIDDSILHGNRRSPMVLHVVSQFLRGGAFELLWLLFSGCSGGAG